MNVPGILQARLFVARNRRVVLVALVLLAVLSMAGAGWAYANPGTQTDTERRNVQTVTAATDTRAVVEGNTSLYDQGTTLVNQQVYPLAASPTLTLAAGVNAPSGATVDQRLVVRYRAVRDGEVVWSEERVLATAAGSVDDAGTLQATVNVTRVRERLATVREAFAGAADVEVQLGHTVAYETDRYQGQLNATVPLGFTQNAYIVDGRLSAKRTHSETVGVTTQRAPNLMLVGGLALIGLVAGAIAAVLVVDPPTVATATDELQRRRYGEWISSGRLPTYAADHYVEMSSLADLVNVAVDSNRRVIHDDQLGAYGIIDEDTLYWYTGRDGHLFALASGVDGSDRLNPGAPNAGVVDVEDSDAPSGDVPPGFQPLEVTDGAETADPSEPAEDGDSGRLNDLFEADQDDDQSQDLNPDDPFGNA